jgi:ATP-binding cassette subfamily B protein
LDSSFRRLFAYVPQGNQLMAGTIREMVTFGSEPTKDMDERIWLVLEEACAKDFVEALPEGLDTVIKERGAGLSEGQLQRIAVARALYTRRPVLLLDEATSALDEKTEQELLLHLKEMTDRTILFVTHRLNALSICDKEIHINGNTVTVRDLNHGH